MSDAKERFLKQQKDAVEALKRCEWCAYQTKACTNSVQGVGEIRQSIDETINLINDKISLIKKSLEKYDE